MRLPDYVQVKEAAALLGVAQNTLRNWERAGKIVVYRHPVNGYRLYKKIDLQYLLDSIAPTRPVTGSEVAAAATRPENEPHAG